MEGDQAMSPLETVKVMRAPDGVLEALLPVFWNTAMHLRTTTSLGAT
jgi:hypothetical protein